MSEQNRRVGRNARMYGGDTAASHVAAMPIWRYRFVLAIIFMAMAVLDRDGDEVRRLQGRLPL